MSIISGCIGGFIEDRLELSPPDDLCTGGIKSIPPVLLLLGITGRSGPTVLLGEEAVPPTGGRSLVREARRSCFGGSGRSCCRAGRGDGPTGGTPTDPDLRWYVGGSGRSWTLRCGIDGLSATARCPDCAVVRCGGAMAGSEDDRRPYAGGTCGGRLRRFMAGSVFPIIFRATSTGVPGGMSLRSTGSYRFGVRGVLDATGTLL